MSSALSSGGLADIPLEMGDRAFSRLNMRLEPDQLQAGEVAVSENGRMEKLSWQPRRGIDSLSGTLQVDGDPLKLPFYLVDLAGGEPVSSASRADELVTVTLTNPLFTEAGSGYLGIEGLTGSVDPNGVRFITVLDPQIFTFEIEGASGSETYAGTGKVRCVLDDDAAAVICGSCLFSDPNEDTDESIIIAANGTAYQVDVATGTSVAIPYPTGLTISGRVDLQQHFDRVTMFREGGAQSWEWYGTKGRGVLSASLTSNVVTVQLKDHGLAVGDSVTLADIGFVTTNPNGVRAVAGLTDKDNFTFALTGADETFTAGTGTAVAGFTKVKAGAFTQPQVFEVTGAAVSVVSGLATITVTGNTTVTAGGPVKIYGTDNTAFEAFVGRTFTAVTATATTISFYIPVADLATIDTDVLSIGKEVSQGSGFMHSPAPPWGVYHQRRLWVPYWYSQTGSTASPTYTDRAVRDEIAASDILDPDTFDVLTNQFRITGGTADFTVGMQPFYEDAILIFQRNSIHGVFGVSGSLADSSVRELTREIGLLARKSLVMHGPDIFFLADNGVYAIGFIDQYNLRGVDTPLSEPIQPVIDRINPDLAGFSVGVYFNNRYFLAVPLDSVAGAGDATGNNAVLVFNFLNKGWESVDSVGDGRWKILNFHISRAGERNDLYAVNDLGGVHKIDALDSDEDTLALSPGDDPEQVAVPWAMQTRQFDGESLERKRYSEVQMQVEAAGQACEADFTFLTEDADAETVIGTISSVLGESLAPNEGASLRMRTGGHRAQGASVLVEGVTGRPKFKSIKVTGTITNRGTTNQT
jgi:hypothetical protein